MRPTIFNIVSFTCCCLAVFLASGDEYTASDLKNTLDLAITREQKLENAESNCFALLSQSTNAPAHLGTIYSIMALRYLREDASQVDKALDFCAKALEYEADPNRVCALYRLGGDAVQRKMDNAKFLDIGPLRRQALLWYLEGFNFTLIRTQPIMESAFETASEWHSKFVTIHVFSC